MLNLAKKKKVELTGSQNHRKEESTLALKLTGYIDSSFTRALSLSPSVFPSHFYFCILATFKWELQPLLALEPTLTASMPKTKTDLLFLLQLEQFGVRKGLMWMHSMSMYSFPGSASGKEPAHQGRRRRRCGFGPGSGRSPGGRNDNLFQYSCVENPMNRGTWWATVHGVPKNWAWLSGWECMHTQSGYTAIFKMCLHSPFLSP